MKNNFKKISAFILIISFAFGMNSVTYIKHAEAQTSTFTHGVITGLTGPLGGLLMGGNPVTTAATEGTKWVGVQVVEIILTFISYFTALGGKMLNASIFYTIVKVEENYSNLKAISQTWMVVRDVANMGFIFILLYAAIKTIVGQGDGQNQKLIKNIILIAILINFSLFFTKVIIDASNLLALTFYDFIVPGAASQGASSAGLSDKFMELLKLQGLYQAENAKSLEPGLIITRGIMGSIMLLVAAFSFFAVALMFVIRYVVLIIVLILSPLAFIAHILPKNSGLEGEVKRWWDALLGQAFFAPVYLFMTLITLKILNGITTVMNGSLADPANFGVRQENGSTTIVNNGFVEGFINYLIVIIFMVASLMIAKKWADKANGMSKLTSWATGVAGGATIGLAGRFTRNTIGRAGNALGQNEWLKDKAANSNFVGKFAAQQALKGSRKVGSSSFDLRATRVGEATVGSDAGKAGGKGGYSEYVKKKAEAEEKFANSLGPSVKTIAKAEEELRRAIESKDSERIKAAQNVVNKLKGVSPKDAEKQRSELDRERDQKIKEDDAVKKAEEHTQKIKEMEDKLIEAKEVDDMATYQALAQELSALKASTKGIVREAEQAKERIKNEYETRKAAINPVKGTGEQRKNAYADSVQKSRWAKFRGYNYEASAKIRRDKSEADKLLEAAKKALKAEESEPEKPKTPPAPPSPTAPTTTP